VKKLFLGMLTVLLTGLTAQAQTINFDATGIVTGNLGQYSNPSTAGTALLNTYPDVFADWGFNNGFPTAVADLTQLSTITFPGHAPFGNALLLGNPNNATFVEFGPLLNGDFVFVQLYSNNHPGGGTNTGTALVSVFDANGIQVGSTESFQVTSITQIGFHTVSQEVPAGGFVEIRASNGSFYIDDILAAGGPVPVELTSFRSYLKDDVVELQWTTATELNNYGFDIERSRDGDVWTPRGFVIGHGTTFSPREYSFTDRDLDRSGSAMYYRLKQMDRDGTTEYSPVLRVALPAAETVEMQAFPQPFVDQLNIDIASDEDVFMTVQLYNSAMQEVATVYEGQVDGVMSLAIPTGNLRDGSYFLVARKSNGESQLRKVLRVSTQ
jgi:hypothetical protein